LLDVGAVVKVAAFPAITAIVQDLIENAARLKT
jgi:hypothetical protein